MQTTNHQPGFFVRLKQHHIYRVAAAYGAAIAVLIQIVARAFPYFGWSAAVPAVIIVLIAGFPVALVIAWLWVKPADAGEQRAGRKRNWKLGAVVTSIVIAAVVVSGIYAFRFSAEHEARLAAEQVAASSATHAAVATVIPAKSIAVLPFQNLSTDKSNAYFADGIQDLILTKLADIGDLKVIARTSTMQYGAHPQNLTQVGQQLGVATILEGSVQKAGDQVLINVQLIDANSDSHIWAQSYQRTLTNIFGVEGEVAQQVADALQAKLSPAKAAQLAAVPTTNQAAYDLFLRAEYLVNQGDVNFDTVGYEAAIPLYRQAIAQDPSFALAYAQLSYAESGVVWFGSGEGDKQLVADGRAQAEKALALQPNLVAAYVALGYNAYWGRQDYPAALKAFAAALKLRPNDADALAATGYVLRRQAHFDAAIKALQRALALDPRNSSLADGLGETCAAIGRSAEAGQFFRRALALDPDNYQAKYDYSSLILVSSGDVARALAVAQSNAPELQLLRTQLLTLQRKYFEARALLADIPDNSVNLRLFSYQTGPKTLSLANLYRLMGNSAQARPLYAQALTQSHTRLTALAGDSMKLSFVWNHIAAAELGLGQTGAALTAIAKSQALIAQSGDRFVEPGITEFNAALYARAGRADLAVPLLAKALATSGIGGSYSPVLLWIDPAWDPIRQDPRFQALLKKYAQYKPAVIPAFTAAQAN